MSPCLKVFRRSSVHAGFGESGASTLGGRNDSSLCGVLWLRSERSPAKGGKAFLRGLVAHGRLRSVIETLFMFEKLIEEPARGIGKTVVTGEGGSSCPIPCGFVASPLTCLTVIGAGGSSTCITTLSHSPLETKPQR